ncbi:MAG: hypothetical protein M3144_12510, partial [Actinomycetota bacterium]|nr:hypothetical protein [Actinomycetota bacterium]
ATGDTWHDVRRRLGLTPSRAPGPPAPRRLARARGQDRTDHDPDRRDRVDAELLAAGIGPGHPSLYADGPPEPDGEREG